MKRDRLPLAELLTDNVQTPKRSSEEGKAEEAPAAEDGAGVVLRSGGRGNSATLDRPSKPQVKEIFTLFRVVKNAVDMNCFRGPQPRTN